MVCCYSTQMYMKRFHVSYGTWNSPLNSSQGRIWYFRSLSVVSQVMEVQCVMPVSVLQRWPSKHLQCFWVTMWATLDLTIALLARGAKNGAIGKNLHYYIYILCSSLVNIYVISKDNVIFVIFSIKIVLHIIITVFYKMV